MNTFDFIDQDKVQFDEDDKQPKDGPIEIDGLLVDVVNTDQRDFVMFTDLMAELEEI
jgi:hypothetical protein